MPSPFVLSPSPSAPMRPCHPNKCGRPFALRKNNSCKTSTPSCLRRSVSRRDPMLHLPGNITTRMGNIASGKVHLSNSIRRLLRNTLLVAFSCLCEMWGLPRSFSLWNPSRSSTILETPTTSSILSTSLGTSGVAVLFFVSAPLPRVYMRMRNALQTSTPRVMNSKPQSSGRSRLANQSSSVVMLANFPHH